MNDVREIVRKVRQIELRTARPVSQMLAGQYHSVFRGRGIDFDRVREYVPGDDVRAIDWNVTARAGRPHVKEFTEERELHVVLLVDLSASGEFGSSTRAKRELAAEVASVLAFSAMRNRDRVSAILFTDRVERYVPPGKGRAHVLRVIREILACEPQGRRTDVAAALEHLCQVTRKPSIVFLVSDLQVSGDRSAELAKIEHALRLARPRHDVVAVRVRDRREEELPDVGVLTLEDAETGELVVLDTARAKVRRAFADEARRERDETEALLRRAGVDSLEVYTDAPYVPAFVAFFRGRGRRSR